jgi:mRNA-degrading endonuclease toxin of MazEF toxin-antitoxin module
MLLRSTIATGMQQDTENAATSELASRTTSIGLAKKKRKIPSAIVMTAKDNKTPRPTTANARASVLLAQSIHAIDVTFASASA